MINIKLNYQYQIAMPVTICVQMKYIVDKDY